MEKLLMISLLCAVLHSTLAVDVDFSYTAQGAWPGDCTTGMRQSPIDIVTANTQEDSSLGALQFSNSWDSAISGVFENTGHTVQFNPAADTDVTTTLPELGAYQFLQVHLHWGNTSSVGSEHTIDGQSTALEIHFVHERITTDGPDGESFAVVGVLADVSSEAISGPWASLDASMITNDADTLNITDFTLSSLLPSDRAPYYRYAGSLTTPNCDEVVQWFVLRERVTVPATYLQQLRQVRDVNSDLLTMNFRDTQPLNGRVVRRPSSDAVIASASLIAVLALALLASVFSY